MFHEKKRMRAPHFLFSNNIVNPSSNRFIIKITANIFLCLKCYGKTREQFLHAVKIYIENVKT